MSERPGEKSAVGGNMIFRHQYETLRSLMFGNGVALQLMADLEADLNYLDHSKANILRPVRRLEDQVLLMAQELNLLTSDRYSDLYDVLGTIRSNIHSAFKALPVSSAGPLSIMLGADESFDAAIVGGKAAGLEALRQIFPDMVAGAFVISTVAYRQFVEENELADRIRLLLTDLDVMTGQPRFQERTRAIRDLILAAPIPEPIQEAIQQCASAVAEASSSATTGTWAVRSSATSEDAGFTFAGQFDSLLNVPSDALAYAYRSVLASRFSDRAVLYRMHFGFREVDTPMAVLFMPMVDPKAAGVVYSRDPQEPESGKAAISWVGGLADRLVRGDEQGETRYLSRDASSSESTTLGGRGRATTGKNVAGAVAEEKNAESSAEEGGEASLGENSRLDGAPGLSESMAARIVKVAIEASRALGYEVDLEWAVDKQDRLHLLQGRRLRLYTPEVSAERAKKQTPPLLESGYTLFPGRAEGPVERIESENNPVLERKAPVLVIDHGTLALGPLLPYVAALLIEHGTPVGHLATLVREFRVPAIYGLKEGTQLLEPGEVISVNATRRRIHRGARWPGVRERVLARVAAARRSASSGPLYDFVLTLNLTDAQASEFKAKNCRSLHDVVRFVHEMSVRSMFQFGDRQNRFWKRSLKRLDSSLPIKLRLVDLDGCTAEGKRTLDPDDVGSIPFQALSRGMADPRVRWERRRISAIENMPADFVEQVFGGTRGPRRPHDTNYALVASDYLNLNARFVFHYAMLDAIVGPGKETNHVHFRYRGGGAGEEQTIRRARFLETVLRHFHFGVDRQGGLVTAWLRNYPRDESEQALEMLGRLMACSRQLDMLLSDDDMIERYVRRFLNQDYVVFG